MFLYFYIILQFILLLIIIWAFWRFYYFFRDPQRKVPIGNNIVSVADGIVVYIKKIDKGEVPISIKGSKKILLHDIIFIRNYIIKDPHYIIGVFMTPFDVHVNRAPIEGVISFQKYINNRKNLPMTSMWLRVMFKKKPFEKESRHILENERNIIHFKGRIPVTVIQIADIYVNKIISYVKEGDYMKKGDRIGMIRMGSQVDIIFPCLENISIKVQEGDRVFAGSSIIAEY